MASDEYERPARRPYLYEGYYLKFKKAKKEKPGSPLRTPPLPGSPEAKAQGCLCQDPQFVTPKDYDHIRRAIDPDCPLHEIVLVKPEDLK